MTLYEEVGLARNATAEEIRQAYHHLVRRLHPDGVQDPLLRGVAEAQLRRLNGAFEVLNDAKRRADYDLSLDTLPPPGLMVPMPPVNWPREGIWRSMWGVGALAIAAIIGAGIFTDSSSVARAKSLAPKQDEDAAREAPSKQAAAASTAPVGTVELTEQMRELRRELQREIETVRQSRAEAIPAGSPIDENAGEREVAANDADAPSLATMSRLTLPAALSDLSPVAQSPPARPALAGNLGESIAGNLAGALTGALTGTWLYVQHTGEAARRDWYPPVFIELKIRPAGNGIAGRFQARYSVGDRPISPDVRFHFEGAGEVLHWSSADGAHGEVRLKQTSPMTLLVEWSTTHPGSAPSLVAGSSVLVKSQE